MGERGARYSHDVGEFAIEVVEALAPLGDIGWRKMFGRGSQPRSKLSGCS